MKRLISKRDIYFHQAKTRIYNKEKYENSLFPSFEDFLKSKRLRSCAKNENLKKSKNESNYKKINKRKSIIKLKKDKAENIHTKDNLYLEFRKYFENNKPPGSHFVLDKRSIAVNYYLHNKRRTARTFTFKDCDNLEDFKSLVHKVLSFVTKHKIYVR